ncbi:carbonic anhydrase [Roseomonas sp. NAR14]|uniref:Carbonic anhydrase n=1 Tax=Roseomonas acroporae TaxID=2937791 RepID=A0A9X2BYC2_9PROT|nr:carbonic anhydrase [Roseomonas acroporae]MCK8785850.1 carbonic anhydrase [Roseomonas acroporae]
MKADPCACSDPTRHGRAFARRGLLAGGAGLLACAALPGGVPGLPRPALAADPHGPRTSLTPDQALELLKKGNDEYAHGQPFHGDINRERRIAIALAQAPFCVLVCCSDSRVPPELLFGRGLGELFIVRNAGNTVDTAALGSIEYAVGVLGVPLVMVLGHERCGAVAAAIEVVERNATFPGSIGPMVEPIVPAVLQARAQMGSGSGGDLLDRSVRANVRRIVARLPQQSAVLQGPMREGKLRIVGARYDLDDGDVDFFDS